MLAGLAAQGGHAAPLPSGLAPELKEVLVDMVGSEIWARFRFELPELHEDHAAHRGFADVAEDFGVLCTTLVLPYLRDHEIPADRVVISFGDRVVEFGAPAPDVVQFFEQFRIADGECIWEGI